MTCPRNNPHLLWPISLWMRELLASLAVNFVKGHIHYNKCSSCILLVLRWSLYLHQEINATCNVHHGWRCVHGQTEIRFSTRETFITFNAVERLYSRTRAEPALCPVNQRGTPGKRGEKNVLSTILALLTWSGQQNERYVVLWFYNTAHFHISWSFLQRAA